MKIDIFKNPIIAIFSFFLLLFLYSKFAPSIPLSILSQQKGEPLIITETGTVTAVPDIAIISLGIEESGTSLEETQNSVNKKSNNLTKELRALGIEDKDIKTSNYNLYPDYDWEKEPRKISGYKVSISYQVKLKDFEKINNLIAKVGELGVNTIGNISFEVSEDTEKKLRREARQEAFDKAKEKAKGLAQVANFTLGKIINISENSPIYRYSASYAIPESGGGGTDIEKPDIKPGETEITSTISVSWEIR